MRISFSIIDAPYQLPLLIGELDRIANNLRFGKDFRMLGDPARMHFDFRCKFSVERAPDRDEMWLSIDPDEGVAT